jgi:hypothetical protein
VDLSTLVYTPGLVYGRSIVFWSFLTNCKESEKFQTAENLPVGMFSAFALLWRGVFEQYWDNLLVERDYEHFLLFSKNNILLG